MNNKWEDEINNLIKLEKYADALDILITGYMDESIDPNILKNFLENSKSISKIGSENEEGHRLFLACRWLIESSDSEYGITQGIGRIKKWMECFQQIQQDISTLFGETDFASPTFYFRIREVLLCSLSCLYLKAGLRSNYEENLSLFMDIIREVLSLPHNRPDISFTSPNIHTLEGMKDYWTFIDTVFDLVLKSTENFSGINRIIYLIKWLIGGKKLSPEMKGKRQILFPFYIDINKRVEIGEIHLCLFEGIGEEISLHPVISPFLQWDNKFQKTIENIYKYFQYYNELTKIFKNKYILWYIKLRSGDCLEQITDISFGGAFGGASISLLKEVSLDPSSCVTAGVDEKGNLIAVGYVENKLKKAIENKIKTFIICDDNFSDSLNDYKGDTKLKKCKNIEEISKEITFITSDIKEYLQVVKNELMKLPSYYPEGMDFEMMKVEALLTDMNQEERDRKLKEASKSKNQDKNKPSYPSFSLKYSWTDPIIRKAVILGEAGHGKTWLLKNKALESIHEIESILNAGEKGIYEISLFPVFLRLNDIASRIEDGKEIQNIIIDFVISRYFSSNCRDREGIKSYLKFMFTKNRLLLLLDALDEVEHSKKVRLINELADFLKGKKIPVILSSRKTGYAFPDNECGLQRMEIQPFEEEQIEKFIDNWFSCNCIPSIGGSGEIGDSKGFPLIYHEIKNIQSTSRLARVPLLLSFMCKMYQEGKIPSIRSRHDVFIYSIKGLLDDWQKEKTPHSQHFQLFIHDKVRLLEYTAFYMWENNLEYPSLFKITEIFNKGIEKLNNEGIFRSDKMEEISQLKGTKGDKILKELEKDGIMVKYGKDEDAEYSFPHRSFLEYFTSAYISQQENWKEIVEKLIKDYASPIKREITEEIITLLSGSYPRDYHKKDKALEYIIPQIKSEPIHIIKKIIQKVKKKLQEIKNKKKTDSAAILSLKILAGKCFMDWNEEFRNKKENKNIFQSHTSDLFKSLNIKKLKQSEEIVETLSLIGGNFVIDYIIKENEDTLKGLREGNKIIFEYFPDILGKIGSQRAKEILLSIFENISDFMDYCYYDSGGYYIVSVINNLSKFQDKRGNLIQSFADNILESSGYGEMIYIIDSMIKNMSNDENRKKSYIDYILLPIGMKKCDVYFYGTSMESYIGIIMEHNKFYDIIPYLVQLSKGEKIFISDEYLPEDPIKKTKIKKVIEENKENSDMVKWRSAIILALYGIKNENIPERLLELLNGYYANNIDKDGIGRFLIDALVNIGCKEALPRLKDLCREFNRQGKKMKKSHQEEGENGTELLIIDPFHQKIDESHQKNYDPKIIYALGELGDDDTKSFLEQYILYPPSVLSQSYQNDQVLYQKSGINPDVEKALKKIKINKILHPFSEAFFEDSDKKAPLGKYTNYGRKIISFDDDIYECNFACSKIGCSDIEKILFNLIAKNKHLKGTSHSLLSQITNENAISQITKILETYPDTQEIIGYIGEFFMARLRFAKDEFPFKEKLIEAFEHEDNEVRDFAQEMYEIIYKSKEDNIDML